ncbi:MAG: hypothetical protein ACTSQY_03850 [Candidatus Odinarchaeia archaeon]
MQKKKDVVGLIKYLEKTAGKNDADAGRAVIALLKIGKPSVIGICYALPSIKDYFVKFTLIRVLYKLNDKLCKDCLISEIKQYLETYRLKQTPQERHGKSAVYYMAVKTLKHLGIPPEEWGLSSEAYYDKIRKDYLNSES